MTRARITGADAEREVELLSRVIETISAGLELDVILQGTAKLVTETTDTDVCFVHLLDEQGRLLQLRGATPPFDDLVGKIELGIGEGVAGWVAAHGEPAVIVDDKTADPRYRYIPALRGEEFTSMVSVQTPVPSGLAGITICSKPVHPFGATQASSAWFSAAGVVYGVESNQQLAGLGCGMIFGVTLAISTLIASMTSAR